MPQRPFVRAIKDAADPRDKAAIFARHLRESAARTAGVLSVIDSAASTDPEIAALWRTLQDQGLRGMTMAASSFQEQQILRTGLTVARAADILWLYTGRGPTASWSPAAAGHWTSTRHGSRTPSTPS